MRWIRSLWRLCQRRSRRRHLQVMFDRLPCSRPVVVTVSKEFGLSEYARY
jgi:hypothetical protein